MGIDLSLYVDDVRTSPETHQWDSTISYWFGFSSLYLDDVRTSEKTNLSASTACYEMVSLFYVDDVRNSQEAYLWAFTVCYEDSFAFYMQMIFVPYRKHVYGPPWPVTDSFNF
jgi:hypothetical protein